MFIGLEKYRSCLKKKRFDGPAKRRRPDVEYYIPVDPFVSDDARNSQTMAFRRLHRKAQVFSDPQNPNVRDRGSHTMEARNVAGVSSDFMGLRYMLCSAIMLGHDTWHTPFGHGGESHIAKLAGNGPQFEHQKFGVIGAQLLEDPRIRDVDSRDIPESFVPMGLNLTLPVLEGILYHSTNSSKMEMPAGMPEEYTLCMYADKLAYTFADVGDAIRMGKLTAKQLRKRFKIFDFETMCHEQMQALCMRNLIIESAEMERVSFANSHAAVEFKKLRDFMYQEVYDKIDWTQQRKFMECIYHDFLQQDKRFESVDTLTLLCMLEDRQIYTLAEIMRRQERITEEVLQNLGIAEIIPYVRNRKIDYAKVDLNPADFVY